MKVQIFIPWAPAKGREHARTIVLDYMLDNFRDWWAGFAFDDVEPGLFRRGAALNIAAQVSDADVVVFNDADSIVDPAQLAQAVELAADTKAGVRAYLRYRRIDQAHSGCVETWEQVFDQPTYWEQLNTPSHGVSAFWRRAFVDAGGYDPRFVYFYDDSSFELRTNLVGSRIDGDLFHLWHPPQQAPDSDEELWRRYQTEDPELVRWEAGFPC